jgi:hypothetical protein
MSNNISEDLDLLLEHVDTFKEWYLTIPRNAQSYQLVAYSLMKFFSKCARKEDMPTYVKLFSRILHECGVDNNTKTRLEQGHLYTNENDSLPLEEALVQIQDSFKQFITKKRQDLLVRVEHSVYDEKNNVAHVTHVWAPLSLERRQKTHTREQTITLDKLKEMPRKNIRDFIEEQVFNETVTDKLKNSLTILEDELYLNCTITSTKVEEHILEMNIESTLNSTSSLAVFAAGKLLHYYLLAYKKLMSCKIQKFNDLQGVLSFDKPTGTTTVGVFRNGSFILDGLYLMEHIPPEVQKRLVDYFAACLIYPDLLLINLEFVYYHSREILRVIEESTDDEKEEWNNLLFRLRVIEWKRDHRTGEA